MKATELDTVPLGSLAKKAAHSFVDGPFGSNLKASEYVRNGVPIIRLQNLKPNEFFEKDIKFITEQKAGELSRHDYVQGDLVIAKLGDPAGTACTIPSSIPEGRIVADVVRFRGENTKVDHRYLAHFLNSPLGRGEIARRSKGTTRKRINLTDLKQVPVPLLPLAEQKRIAAILDKADAIRKKRQQAIALTEDFLRSAFLEMFGDPVTNLKGWEVRPLIELVDEARPITYGILKPGPDIDDGVPYVRVVDINDWVVNIASVRRTSLEIATEYKRSKLHENDLLLSIRGHVGRLALVPPELHGANITQDTARIATNGLCTIEYLLGCVDSIPIQRWMKRHIKGVAVQGINLGDVKEIPIPVPPESLQRKYSQLFKTMSRKVVNSKAAQTHSSDLFNSLVQRAFRGEL